MTEAATYRSGHWKNPMSDDTLKAKFRDLAGRTLTAEAVQAVESIVSSLETQARPGAALGRALQTTKA